MHERAPDRDSVRCPNCAEWILKQAILCRFCNSGLSTAHFRQCPKCAEMVRNEATQCKSCAANLPPVEFDARPMVSGLVSINDRIRASNEDVLPARNLELIKERAKEILSQFTKESGEAAAALSDEQQTAMRARLRELVTADPSRLNMMERGILLQTVLDEVLGFGPLGPLLRDPSLIDIYVDGPAKIYSDNGSGLEQTSAVFDDEQHLRRIVERIIRPFGFELESATKAISCLLSSGTWVIAAQNPETNQITLVIRTKRF